MPKIQRKITLHDVALAAGVSVSSASKALLGGGGKTTKISVATEARIKTVAKSIGYSPSYAARSLAKGSSKCIGFICGAIYPRLLSELIEAAESHHYRLLSMLTRWDVKKELECVENALTGMVDCVILRSSALGTESETRRRLLEKSMPAVLMGVLEGSGFPIIRNDFRPGMHQAFQELVAKGHSGIALLRNAIDTGKLEPYLEQCASFGFEPADFQFKLLEKDNETLRKSCEEIAKSRPDALIVEEGGICMLALKFLKALGVETPKNLSAVCISDDDWLDYLDTPIAIIDYKTKENAHLAIETALSMVKGEQAPPVQFIDTFFRKGDCIMERRKAGKRRSSP